MPVKKSPVKKSPVKKSPVKRMVKKSPVKRMVKKSPVKKTVCLEGYKVTTNGRCIKDKKYNTFVSTVQAPPPPPPPGSRPAPKSAPKISALQAYLNARFAGKTYSPTYGPATEVVKASTKLREQYIASKQEDSQAQAEKAAKSAAYRKAFAEKRNLITF